MYSGNSFVPSTCFLCFHLWLHFSYFLFQFIYIMLLENFEFTFSNFSLDSFEISLLEYNVLLEYPLKIAIILYIICIYDFQEPPISKNTPPLWCFLWFSLGTCSSRASFVPVSLFCLDTTFFSLCSSQFFFYFDVILLSLFLVFK